MVANFFTELILLRYTNLEVKDGIISLGNSWAEAGADISKRIIALHSDDIPEFAHGVRRIGCCSFVIDFSCEDFIYTTPQLNIMSDINTETWLSDMESYINSFSVFLAYDYLQKIGKEIDINDLQRDQGVDDTWGRLGRATERNIQGDRELS